MSTTSNAPILDTVPKGASGEVAEVLNAIAIESVSVSKIIALGALGSVLDAAVGTNSDGDGQKALDVIADEAFAKRLSQTPVRWLASEEREEVTDLNPTGSLAVAIDPLDGSSNIETNVSIGTIFSILPAKDDPNASFLRKGRDQLAAGYVIYGPQTALMVTCGDGVSHYILDRDTEQFRLVTDTTSIPVDTGEYAINASNLRHWSRPIQAYISDCNAGDKAARGRNFNMRWVASLVAETHRIISRGGVFLYPSDGRKGYQNGRLRMIYECAPIAMLIEQSGGLATNGLDPILDQVPDSLHARTPLIFGSANEVARVTVYHDLPEADHSPLFGTRGLFNA